METQLPTRSQQDETDDAAVSDILKKASSFPAVPPETSDAEVLFGLDTEDLEVLFPKWEKGFGTRYLGKLENGQHIWMACHTGPELSNPAYVMSIFYTDSTEDVLCSAGVSVKRPRNDVRQVHPQLDSIIGARHQITNLRQHLPNPNDPGTFLQLVNLCYPYTLSTNPRIATQTTERVNNVFVPSNQNLIDKHRITPARDIAVESADGIKTKRYDGEAFRKAPATNVQKGRDRNRPFTQEDMKSMFLTIRQAIDLCLRHIQTSH